MENNRNEKLIFNNSIEKFLTLCSGASIDILKGCPRTEVIKYAGIGGTILITTLLAFMSGSYALFTVFKSNLAAILFGSIWALMIFNLDRLIVSSMRKRGSWKQQFKMAIPRILLALIIAVVISKPLEVRLLETKINKTLSSETIQQSEDLAMQRERKEEQFGNKIDEETGKITDYQNKKPALLVSLEEQEIKLIEEEKLEKKKADKKNSSNYFHLKGVKKGIAFRKAINPTSEFLQGEIKELENQKNDLETKIWLNNFAVREVKEQLEVIQDQKKVEFDSYNNQFRVLQTQVNEEISRLQKQRGEEIKEFNKLAATTMTAFKNNSLIDQIEALSIASNKNSLISKVSWFIMLLFIVVETAPIFIKLITPRGPYDELLDASEYKSRIQSKTIMKMLDAKEYEVEVLAKDTMNLATHSHNKKFELLAKIDEQDIKQELSNNKAILETISTAHHVLIQDQVNDWLESERSKLKNDKSIYSSNTHRNGISNGEIKGTYKRDYV